MTAVYDQPFGTPLYWRYERSDLPAAVMAYLNNQTEGGPITEHQIGRVKDYLAHWVNAPCWDKPAILEGLPELEELRSTVADLKTPDQIHDWLMRALDIGMDPL